MKNIYTSIVFGVFISVIGMLPAVSDAVSFVPVSRTYYPTEAQPITIVNNNYNNNVNTNNVPALAPAPVYTYSHSSSYHSGITRCVTCVYPHGHRYHRHNRHCGAYVGIGGVTMPKPVCTLVPAITAGGDVELQWTTFRGTVAYIDSGIGHVAVGSGSILVSPQTDTIYNMTVLNRAGISGTCTAKVNVTIDDPVDPVDPVDPGDSGWFGDTFRAIALPIGVAFLILIILLIVIMSKVKNSH